MQAPARGACADRGAREVRAGLWGRALPRWELDPCAGARVKVHLVRHGRAEKRSRWDGPDALRPLTGEGLRHAERIGQRLARSRPERLLASPFLRCRQTLEPLARRLGLRVETREWLAKGEDPEKAADLMRCERDKRSTCRLARAKERLPDQIDKSVVRS